jgi:hypothetical protein
MVMCAHVWRRQGRGEGGGSEEGAALTPSQRRLLAALEAQPNTLQFLFAQRAALVTFFHLHSPVILAAQDAAPARVLLSVLLLEM